MDVLKLFSIIGLAFSYVITIVFLLTSRYRRAFSRFLFSILLSIFIIFISDILFPMYDVATESDAASVIPNIYYVVIGLWALIMLLFIYIYEFVIPSSAETEVEDAVTELDSDVEPPFDSLSTSQAKRKIIKD